MRAEDLDAVRGTVYILDDRSFLPSVSDRYRPESDLVLGFDFALKREIEARGGRAEYVDHLIDRKTMQEENHRIYEYFKVWHLRPDGSDVFEWKGIPFGFAFRQEIWNDFTFYLRLRICLGLLRTAGIRRVVLGTRLPYLGEILQELGIGVERLEPLGDAQAYFFPVFRWMQERVNPNSIRPRLRRLANRAISAAQWVLEKLGRFRDRKAHLFVQVYYPTRKILDRLRESGEYKITLSASTKVSDFRRTMEERLIPMRGPRRAYARAARGMMEEFRGLEGFRLTLGDGSDVSSGLREAIRRRIEDRVSDYIRILDSAIAYFDRHGLDLDIRIANIGITGTLIGQYAEARGVKSYLIVNGMLSKDYLDESKYATVINAYSEGMRDNYFAGMRNVVCLGDPRMDDYASESKKEAVDRLDPTITIGASGFSNVDLNSYLAVEFEFMHDVLSVLRQARDEGRSMKIVIKVRSNGYRKDYERFTAEYFPDLEAEIQDSVPIRTLLRDTDFMISIYSQTLFEASMLGIPALYYKKDTEYFQPPFDGESELTTARGFGELAEAVRDFYEGSPRYDAFLRREVMEKYIGPLDGLNLERNLSFIRRMLDCRAERDLEKVMEEVRK